MTIAGVPATDEEGQAREGPDGVGAEGLFAGEEKLAVGPAGFKEVAELFVAVGTEDEIGVVK